jgi:hypothetical protein
MRRATSLVGWFVVILVGAGVLALVFGFSLFPRLEAGQRVVDRLDPAFTSTAAAGDRAGIDFLSTAVDTLDPIVTANGGGSGEVPKLVAFVSEKTGMSKEEVLATLQDKFPHTTALLQAVPLSDVSAELPKLVQFLATALNTTPEAVQALLEENFPHLYQAITALPAVTDGWDNVPGTEKLTRFDGTPARSATDIRDYYSQDVIPVVENHTTDMERLADWSPRVNYFPQLLTAVGGLALAVGVLMFLYASVSRRRGLPIVAWTAVLLVGVFVVGLVFGLRLFPRFDGGASLVKDAEPVFTSERIAGDQTSITFVSRVVDMADPVLTEQGGASAEVPKLVAFVSKKTGKTAPETLQLLSTNFPHTTALLQALPLSAVSAEIPNLVSFLATALKIPAESVKSTLATDFPHLNQAITYLPEVTDGWYNVPDTEVNTSMHTAIGVRDYFGGTVVPALADSRDDFVTLNKYWPPLDLVAPLLLAVGSVVILWALLFLIGTIRGGRSRTGAAAAFGR